MGLEQLSLMIGLPGYFSQWTRSRDRATLVSTLSRAAGGGVVEGVVIRRRA